MTRINRCPAALAAATLLASALAACSDAPTGSAPERIDATLARQVAALGFRADMIEDHGDFVLVEGDIRLSRAQLLAGPVGPGADPRGPLFQYRTHALVGSPQVNQIVVDLSGLASEPGWAAAARDAMTAWNAVPNSYVRMVEGSPGTISVGTNCGLGANVAAQASWPSGGNPGSTIAVNPCFGWTIGHAQRVHNMAHELGHTLGLRHTNWQSRGEGTGTEGAVHVPGTPTGTDNGSVMNGGTALNSWAGFSTHDRNATATLYPLPALSLSITYPGGQPNVTWTLLSGVTSYTVRRTTFTSGYDEFGSFTSFGNEGIITGASPPFVDTAWSYTGAYSCYYDLGSGYWMEKGYAYAVDAHFPTGTRTGMIEAATAAC